MVHKLNKNELGSRLRISGHASPEWPLLVESCVLYSIVPVIGPQKSGLVRQNQNKEYEIG